MAIAGIISLLANVAPTIVGALARKEGKWYEKALEILASITGSTSLSPEDINLRLQVLDQEKFLEIKKMDHEFKMAMMSDKQELELVEAEIRKLNIKVNLADAQSGSKFQAWWRPALAWTCVVAFMWKYLILPVTVSILAYTIGFGVDPATVQLIKSNLPEFNLGELMTMLGWLLGYGAFRTYEKSKRNLDN